MTAPALGRVGIRKHVQDGAIRADDTIAFNMNEYFDFSRVSDVNKLQYHITQHSSKKGGEPEDIGHLFTGIDDPFYSHDYDESVYTHAAFTKYLDERSFVIITDDGKIIYEETTANGQPRHAEKPKAFKHNISL